MRRHLRALRGDDGRIALLVLVLAFGVLSMIGLAVDGGGKMRALKRADSLAAEAARAAGQAIQLQLAIPGGEKIVDPARAIAAGQSYLASAGATGTVVPGEDGQSVTVTVTLTYNTKLLSLIGIGELSVTGQSTAQLLTG
ncbi:pilus assembly protein TadG-related protein [Micromonospora aurantiaca (nom. illeg.)]|uniref:pilus assembly protein TadG-related protein n=1 Tax=Micromonospora aurantiaca (nom. illeg.) TaxID=47850 RepID=UPI0033D23EA6